MSITRGLSAFPRRTYALVLLYAVQGTFLLLARGGWFASMAGALLSLLLTPLFFWAVARCTVLHCLGEETGDAIGLLRSAWRRRGRLWGMVALSLAGYVPLMLLDMAARRTHPAVYGIEWVYGGFLFAFLSWCGTHLVFENRRPLSTARRVYALMCDSGRRVLLSVGISAVFIAVVYVLGLASPLIRGLVMWALAPVWACLSARQYLCARQRAEDYRRWIQPTDGVDPEG